MGDFSIIKLYNSDQNFYPLIGPFLSRREIVKEFGWHVWDEDNKVWFVALGEKGNVLGFTAVVDNGKTAIFDSSYVIPEQRRKGVYTKLFDTAYIYATNTFSKITALSTGKTIEIYKNHGFNEVRKLKHDTKMEWRKP